MEETLSCSICFEAFRDPVTLPCGHSYCRECLQLFADSSKARGASQTTQQTAWLKNPFKWIFHPRGLLGIDIVLSCPQCRAPANLGREGVAGLAVNRELMANVEDCVLRSEEAALVCSICGDGRVVQTCATCNVFYCDDCLRVMHPSKGPLGRHSLMSAEEYRLSHAKPTPEAKGTERRDEDRSALCDKHTQPYTIFCVTCETAICLGCLVSHNGHKMVDIQSEFENLKKPLIRITKKCETVQRKVTMSRKDLEEAEEAVRKHQDMKEREICKKFIQLQASLQSWKERSLGKERKKHLERQSQCSSAKKDLVSLEDEFCEMLTSSRDLLKSDLSSFLQGHKQLMKTLPDQMCKVRIATRKQDEIKQNLLSALELDPVVPIGGRLILNEVAEKTITANEFSSEKPILKFANTSQSNLKIGDNGFLIHGTRFKRGVYYSAWTDGIFLSGNVTWGFEITVSAKASEKDSCCYMGVIRKGAVPWNNSDTEQTSWYIGMEYWIDQVRFYAPRNAHIDAHVTPCYNKYHTHTGAYRLGFSLNCNEKTLTIRDCDRGQLMATVKNIVLQEPVVPAVGFNLYFFKDSATVRLFKWVGAV